MLTTWLCPKTAWFFTAPVSDVWYPTAGKCSRRDLLHECQVLTRDLAQVLGAGQRAAELVVGVVLGEDVARRAAESVQLETAASQLPTPAQHLLTLVHVVCGRACHKSE